MPLKVCEGIAQRIAALTLRPAQSAQSEPARKMLAGLVDVRKAPDQSNGILATAAKSVPARKMPAGLVNVRKAPVQSNGILATAAKSAPASKMPAWPGDVGKAPDPSNSTFATAAKPGKILAKMQGQMSLADYDRFLNTLQRVEKGGSPPRQVKTTTPTAPATLPRTTPRTNETSVSRNNGAIPAPPPPPPPPLSKALSQSMPNLPVAAWGKVKGASLDEAMAGFEQHYARKPVVKTPNGDMQAKLRGDVQAELRDVLKKRRVQ